MFFDRFLWNNIFTQFAVRREAVPRKYAVESGLGVPFNSPEVWALAQPGAP